MNNRESGQRQESTKPAQTPEKADNDAQERPIAAMHYPPRRVSLASVKTPEEPASNPDGEITRKSILPGDLASQSGVPKAGLPTSVPDTKASSLPTETTSDSPLSPETEAIITTVEQPAIVSPSKLWNKKTITIIMSILVTLAVIMSALAIYVFWPHQTTPEGNLENGIEAMWSKPTVVKFPENFSDEFEPYAIYLPDRQTVAVIAPVKKKGSYIELEVENGRQSGKAKSLNPCNFWKGDRYVEHNGKPECESPNQNNQTKAASQSEPNKTNPQNTVKISGEVIYDKNTFQITANPNNGSEAKQVIGYRKGQLAWINDLDNSGYVTVANNTVFITSTAGKNQVRVQAYRPRETAATAPSVDRIYQIDTKAIKKLDLKNLVYPIASCGDSEIALNQVLPTIPPENDQHTCWIKLVNGQGRAGTAGQAKENNASPVYQMTAANPKNPWIGNGLGEVDQNQDTAMVDLNQDGYLDYLVALKSSETNTTKPVYETDWFGDQVLVQEGKTIETRKTIFVAVVYNPSRPKSPYLIFLTQRTDGAQETKETKDSFFDPFFDDSEKISKDDPAKGAIFSFADGVLSFGPPDGQNQLLKIKVENRKGLPTVTKLERAK